MSHTFKNISSNFYLMVTLELIKKKKYYSWQIVVDQVAVMLTTADVNISATPIQQMAPLGLVVVQ